MSSNVEYKVLKSNIIRSCFSKKGIHFNIDYDKLYSSSQEIGLTLLKDGLESRLVKTDDIPFLNEYFVKNKLEWFERDREFTVISFFVNDKLDDYAKNLIAKIEKPDSDDPDEDKIHDMAELVAKYPCYFATIVSYKNLDPKRIGKPSYFIICRANKVAIKDQAYEYNPEDMA